MRHLIRIFPIALLFVAFTGSVSAADPINTLERSGLWGYEASGVAVRGYDTVAYFTQGKPVEGKEAFEKARGGSCGCGEQCG